MSISSVHKIILRCVASSLRQAKNFNIVQLDARMQCKQRKDSVLASCCVATSVEALAMQHSARSRAALSRGIGTGPADPATARPIFELPSLWAVLYLT